MLYYHYYYWQIIVITTLLVLVCTCVHPIQGYVPCSPSTTFSAVRRGRSRDSSSTTSLNSIFRNKKQPGEKSNADTPSGFTAPKPRPVRKILPPITYGEDSRQYRRTIYNHNDWVKHRNTNSVFYYLKQIPTSGIYRNLCREVAVATSISIFICLWNTIIVGTFQDFYGNTYNGFLYEYNSNNNLYLTLPLTPFTLASPSLGLLLVFRTNQSYKRWDEARKNWGLNINRTRDLLRMVNTFYYSENNNNSNQNNKQQQQQENDLKDIVYCTWIFVRSMKRHLSPSEEDEDNFQKELYDKLPERYHVLASQIIQATHRPNRALQELSYAIDQLPIHFIRKHELHQTITIFEDTLGSSERLLTSPVPLFYMRHTTRILAIWLFLLPLALWDIYEQSWNHIGMIPTTILLGIFLLGIDELANQLEEPFTILPMQAFCDKIYNWCMEIISWTPDDIPSRQQKQQQKSKQLHHAYFVKQTPSLEMTGLYNTTISSSSSTRHNWD